MTAEELLMMSDEIETYSADDALVIDAENRIILTPAGGMLLGVESDEEAERIKFVCPRIVGDNIDLSTLQLRAIYRNANGDKDFRICTDITIDGENIRFSWLLSRKVTRYKGAVNFIICAIRTQSDGSIKNEWNTTLAEGKVLEGLEVDISEEEFEEPKDIVLQLLGMLDEKEAELLEEVENLRADVKADIETTKQKAMDDVEAKGAETLKTIPEDYTYTANLAEENKQLKANAIKRTYSGETIVARDSSQAKFEGLRVFGRSEQVSTTGKNLFDYDTYVANGKTISFEIVGGKTLYRNSRLEVSAEWEIRDANNSLINTFADVGFRESSPILLPENAKYIYTYDDGIERDMYIGYDSDTTYEPYTGNKPSPSVEYPQPIESAGDDGNIDVGVYGKNLLANKATSKTINGVTFTVNDDGSITVNGTTTANTRFNISHQLQTLQIGSYVLSGGYNSSAYLVVYDSEGSILPSGPIKDIGTGCAFALKEKLVNFSCRLVISSGITLSNITFYPMIRLVSIEDGAYEPYKVKQSLPISTPNGLPAIKATDAYLATYTDADGVMWCSDEVDYGRGKYVQRVNKATFDGGDDEKWLTSSTQGAYSITISDAKKVLVTEAPIVYCDQYICRNEINANMPDKSCKVCRSSSTINTMFTIKDLDYTTIEDLKARLQVNPVTLYYQLEEPIESDLSTSEIEAYKALTSNYPTTTILNDENAHMEAVLVADTKNHIEQNYVPKSEFQSVLDRLSAVEQQLLA